MKPNINDLEQCESCEGFFAEDKIQRSGDNEFCANCYNGISEEVRKTGIENLDEYLKSRNLVKDFQIFSCAKWACVTEEEYKELNHS